MNKTIDQKLFFHFAKNLIDAFKSCGVPYTKEKVKEITSIKIQKTHNLLENGYDMGTIIKYVVPVELKYNNKELKIYTPNQKQYFSIERVINYPYEY
jgi:hypothetical protein